MRISSLLDGALSAAFFQGLLGFFDFTLGLAREDGERHVRDGILRFLQTQIREATHNLNDRNALVGIDSIDDQVEFSLFFSSFGSRASGSHHHATRRSGGVDAENFFNLLDELGRFEELRDTENTHKSTHVSHTFIRAHMYTHARATASAPETRARRAGARAKPPSGFPPLGSRRARALGPIDAHRGANRAPRPPPARAQTAHIKYISRIPRSAPHHRARARANAARQIALSPSSHRGVASRCARATQNAFAYVP